MDSKSSKETLNEPVGIILLQEEPEMHILIKWLAWIIVMVVFVLILISVSKYFASPTCHLHIERDEPVNYESKF